MPLDVRGFTRGGRTQFSPIRFHLLESQDSCLTWLNYLFLKKKIYSAKLADVGKKIR